MRDYFYLSLYKTFSFFLSIFSRNVRLKVIKALAWFAYHVSKKHQHIIDTNLDFAFENQLTAQEKKRIGIHSFINLIDTTFGIIERDKMTKEEVIKNVTFENEEIIKFYQKADKPFIFVTGHYGNWELLSQSIAIYFDLTLVGVGRELDSKKMDEILIKNRERFNVEMVYKNGAMKGCIKAISQKKTIGILVDQNLGIHQSVDVTFFNHKTTHTPIASILSRKFGTDMIPAYISTKDYENYTVTVYPPITSLKTENQEKDLQTMTQAQADIMEQVIRKQPEQWFWQHKRWKEYYRECYTK